MQVQQSPETDTDSYSDNDSCAKTPGWVKVLDNSIASRLLNLSDPSGQSPETDTDSDSDNDSCAKTNHWSL